MIHTMEDAIREVEKLQDEISDCPNDFGTPREVEAAIQVLEVLRIRLESMQPLLDF